MTTQNVAWPMTIVQMPNGRSAVLNELFSAMPVTMPGRAMGSSSRKRDRLAPEEAVAMHREGRAATRG